MINKYSLWYTYVQLVMNKNSLQLLLLIEQEKIPYTTSA